MLRCGLIGYGAWGSYHARVIADCDGAQLVAIAARSEATRAKAEADHPAARVYADYRELLDREELDAAVVVLPSHLHCDAGRAALESGRHLLLEKPMCLRVVDCDALVALARDRKRVLAIGHEMRHSSLWGRVKQLVEAGAIGKPLYALVELWRQPYRLGADGWRYDIARVGNWILEEPIHFFDLARWYFQPAARPTSVFAQANSRRADHPELTDYFAATVTFSGGQVAAIAQCLGGWEHHQVVKVSGSEGAIWATWSGAMDRTLSPTFSLKVMRGDAQASGAVEEIAIDRKAGEVFELADQFAHFVRAVETGVPPAATGEDGREAVRLCLAAAESARTGEPIQMMNAE